ncbi:cytochrome p450 domain-containing protein [Hirsutella rhossiliensis]|uniref:Cytochrome p450 domain-containing protein n=1 Tax=Hirsutella rhossiliensis TaxID=111463 RepID=A0A9P8N2D6_9HYPO|nr:cytochrome p450 domain-containing protein [Hirsutella rhossiliensis]KAH0964589.1 cytochrome p450 domain-containing protein [Hirsutella rhossiliensis]
MYSGKKIRNQSDNFFTKGDPVEYRARFQPVASLFAKRHYDQCEPNVQENVERFSKFLSSYAQHQKPVNLAMGYRSLFLKIINDFIFSSIPETMRSLANQDFDDPLCLATFAAINWTEWFSTNFPRLNMLALQLPRRLVSLVTTGYDPTFQVYDIVRELVQHEKHSKTAKNTNCLMQRFINAHLESKSQNTVPLSEVVLEDETILTMYGGIVDLANIVPFGTFMVSEDSRLQQRLYEELKSVWPDRSASVPSYEVLRHLPLLAVVSAPSYFVHMDPVAYPDPKRFDPERWIKNDHPGPIVAFSKGRRMCPAVHLANIEMFATFATVFRRYIVVSYETSIEDFEWSQYFSIHFTGRQLRALLKERDL